MHEESSWLVETTSIDHLDEHCRDSWPCPELTLEDAEQAMRAAVTTHLA